MLRISSHIPHSEYRVGVRLVSSLELVGAQRGTARGVGARGGNFVVKRA